MAGSAPETPIPSVKFHGLCSCTAAAADINCSVGASVSSPSSQSEDAVGKKTSHPGKTCTGFHLTGKIEMRDLVLLIQTLCSACKHRTGGERGLLRSRAVRVHKKRKKITSCFREKKMFIVQHLRLSPCVDFHSQGTSTSLQ